LVPVPGDDPFYLGTGTTSYRTTDALIHRLYLVTWAMGSKW
jgi:hypothetical protein